MTIFTGMAPIGNMLVFLWPFAFIDSSERSPLALKRQFLNYFISITIPVSILLIITFFGFRENKARIHFDKYEKKISKIGYKQQFKTLFRDPCYIFMLFAAGISSACLGTIGDVFNSIIAPFGFQLVKNF